MILSCLPRLTLESARQLQFRLVDAITREFRDNQWLTRGDLGVLPDGHGSQYTRAVERVLARMFSSEDAVLVTGAGTGALRAALFALLPPLSPVLVHAAPLYPTTQVTFRVAGFVPVPVDLHNPEQISQVVGEGAVKAALIQHTRQQLSDHYDLATVIATLQAYAPELPILVDDNYAVANTPRIGVELGADISAFSAFKLLGPEGIGLILGPASAMERVRADMYSGGSRVQGFQAQEVLIGLSSAFVANATTQDVAYEVVSRLPSQPPVGVVEAHVFNAQSPVVLVRFDTSIAAAVISAAARQGAASFPVGAMSKYELVPMFYRIAGTMARAMGADEAAHWIRINPMRAGADRVLEILAQAVAEVRADVP